MKKVILGIAVLALFSTIVFASIEEMIIRQKDTIYSDLSYLCNAGLIKSVVPDYFMKNAITKNEAVMYIAEALGNANEKKTIEEKAALTAGENIQAKSVTETAAFNPQAAAAIIDKYSKKYSAELVAAQNTGVSAGLPAEPQISTVDRIRADILWLEKEYSDRRFTDASSFKVSGTIGGRWLNLETFGITNLHRSSFGGSHIEFVFESALNNNVKINTNMTLEMPQNSPAYGTTMMGLAGDERPVWLDVYTLTFDIYGVRAITGFFWEDITSLIASQGQSERIGIFERDVYSGEVGTKSHFETVFRNFSQNRDQRWSKHPFHGAELYKDGLFGKDIFKIMGGKALESLSKGRDYEFAARYTHFRNFPFVRKAEWSLNYYNNSNDPAEAGIDSVSEPQSLKKDITIVGGDAKAVLFGLFNLKAEFERSSYNGHIEVNAGNTVPAFTQEGNAMYAHLAPTFLPKQLDIVLKYTQIDPGYVAPASAVSDTNHRVASSVVPGEVDITSVTYAGDPTSLYNNMAKIEAQAFVNVPYGILMINYGVAAQLKRTGNIFYSGHWLLNSEWWQSFYSNYGYPDSSHGPFMSYNTNRYNSSNYTSASMIDSGTGGMATDLFQSNREYMASSDVAGDTYKYYSNLMLLLRYEISRLIKFSSPLMLELYMELNKLSDGADFLPYYDPSELFAQNNMSACLIYNVIPKLSLIGYAATERWGANSVIPKAIYYIDNVYGFGADYDLAGRTFLYLRLKNFYHTDYYVHENDFRGFSVWAEIKSFF